MACSSSVVIVGGVAISTSAWQNANSLITTVSDDQGDPTLDEYTENIATGNNTANTKGIQISGNPTIVNSTSMSPTGTIPKQTSLPPPITQPASASNTSPVVAKNGSQVSPGVWDGTYTQQLSTNFTVGSFTTNTVFPHPLINYLTYTTDIRFTNLQGLSQNVAEALLSKFGMPRVNSGIRNETSTPTGISQHITGQAADFQWPSWNYAMYWENAQWVKDNIPYDQFIFEHSPKTGLAWFHLSFNNAGNRAADDRTKVMTMYQNHYSPGLHRYG